MAINDLLQQIFGGDKQRQDDYADFARRAQQDPSSISDEEAARRYREMMRNAPPEVVAEANAHVAEQLPQEDRDKMADVFRKATNDPDRPYDGYNYPDHDTATKPDSLGRMAGQASQQDPDLLEQLAGKDSPLNSTIGRAALAAGAAYLASRVLGGMAQRQSGTASGGGLLGGGSSGGLLGGGNSGGGLLGGLGGNSNTDTGSGNINNTDFESGGRL